MTTSPHALSQQIRSRQARPKFQGPDSGEEITAEHFRPRSRKSRLAPTLETAKRRPSLQIQRSRVETRFANTARPGAYRGRRRRQSEKSHERKKRLADLNAHLVTHPHLFSLHNEFCLGRHAETSEKRGASSSRQPRTSAPKKKGWPKGPKRQRVAGSAEDAMTC